MSSITSGFSKQGIEVCFTDDPEDELLTRDIVSPLSNDLIRLHEPFPEDVDDVPHSKRSRQVEPSTVYLEPPFCEQAILIESSSSYTFAEASLCEQDVQLTNPFSDSNDGSDVVSQHSSSHEIESDSPVYPSDDPDIPIDEPCTFEFPNCDSDASEKLYPSTELTLIQALAVLFSWFGSYPGISKEAFSRLLYLLHTFFLPAGNILPHSYYTAYRIIKQRIVPVQEFDCCVNDCVVFRDSAAGNFQRMTVCPTCGEDRYHPCTKIPRKRFKYIPLVPRLRRMYGNETVSKLLQSHTNSTSATTPQVTDIHQSPAWIAKFGIDGSFQGDPRGLALALCTDGMNPFAKEKVTYSMWPITLSVLNLPRRIRNLAGSMLLMGIIPGRKEPKHLDPYLAILVDEILEINGTEIYDSYQREVFHAKLEIIMNVLDYPGQNKVFHCEGAAAYAGCSYCTHIGHYSKALTKMVYYGSRRFLPSDHDLRNDYRNFPNQEQEHSNPPEMKTMNYVDRANHEYESATTTAEKKKLSQTTGCKGTSSHRRLPFHDRILSTPVDPMHLIKNIVSHLIKLISGLEDSRKVREEEKSNNRFPTAWVRATKNELSHATFSLSKDDIAVADERARKVLVPTGFDWRPRPIFRTSTGMKSHEYKQIATNGILKFCLRGMLGYKQRQTLF